FDIQKSVFERAIDPRFFINDLKELGEVKVNIIAENIPQINEKVTDEHCFKANVTLLTEEPKSAVEDILEFIINEGVELKVIQEESNNIQTVEIESEEIPKKLLENYMFESKNIIERLNSQLINIKHDRHNKELINGLFRDFHTLKGGTGVLLSYQIIAALEAIKDIAHLTEGMLVKFRDNNISLEDDDIDIVQHAVDRLDDLVGAYEQNIEFDKSDVEDVLNILESKTQKSLNKQISYTKNDSIEIATLKELVNQYFSMYEDILKQEHISDDEFLFLSTSLIAMQKILKESGFNEIVSKCEELLNIVATKEIDSVKSGLNTLISMVHEKIASKPVESVDEVSKTEKDASKYIQKSSNLRIDESVVDELMNLVGEMSVFKEWIGFFVNKLNKEYRNSEASRELKEKSQRFTNLVNSMQNNVLEMRMMPLSTLFERFPKLIRDLSRTLHKKIDFKIEGGDTKLDKVIIEKIGEPMVHLIRNAIDHGLESPKERISAGKDDTGLVCIKAYQLAGNVYIEVIDDGQGIDTQKVKEKVLRNGIIDEDKLNLMSDEEINMLVMLPGFSTKDEATEVSGRGVGTDAVANAVRSVGGEIKLESKKSVGTKITLELPLTLAIQKILLLKVSSQIYGIAADSISEIIKVEKEKIAYFKDLHVFMHRGDTVSISYADEILGIKKCDEKMELTLLIDNSKKRAIAVESLLNTIDTVVKPVPNILSDINIMSGVTILGDGTIVYILDL
ncbi:MAG: chemotaxis protein CheA, partial [Epsilonproteobacteria bacterium]|nr:chemotaxis protein CheA [Campylobacterota bacterium]